MKLTKEEFCTLNLKSKIILLNDNGVILMEKKIDKKHHLQLFLIFNFYVEVFYDILKRETLIVKPLFNKTWLDLYKKPLVKVA